MASSWEMSPADAQAGDPGPLRIFDPGDGPEGRAVCNPSLAEIDRTRIDALSAALGREDTRGEAAEIVR